MIKIIITTEICICLLLLALFIRRPILELAAAGKEIAIEMRHIRDIDTLPFSEPPKKAHRI